MSRQPESFPRRRCGSATGSSRTIATTTSTPCSWRWARLKACSRPCRAPHLHPVPSRIRGHPAIRGELDGRQPVALGPPVAQHHHGLRLRRLRAAVRRGRHRRFPGNANAELFLRWMQYGALTPFCRNHSETGHIDQYAWAFGEVIHDLVRDAVQLRYRLLPYIYASFVRSSETGERCSARSSSTSSTSRHGGHRRRVPLRARPARGAGRRARDDGRQVYLPVVAGTTGSATNPRRPRLRHRADPDGPDPRVCQGRLGDPHVAGGPAVHRRLPPRGRGAAPLRPSRRGATSHGSSRMTVSPSLPVTGPTCRPRSPSPAAETT